MLKSLLFLTTGFIFGSQQPLSADNYRWPMKLAPELTSRFCDFRAGHFHAGLDIRTKGKTGYRVYAVEDGHIFRITTSYKGYGKAVYLRLDDGRIAVYGHLLSFEKKLDERVRKIQVIEKQYRQDLYFKAGEIPVKRGQVVGLSGASGAGAPHLHFEFRSPDNNPINPLKFGFGIEDSKQPEFHKLALRVYPDRFDPGAAGHIEIMDILKTGIRYTLPDTIFADGYIAMAVSGGDKVDGRGFLYGFYSLKMFVDDSLIFSSTADSITYESTEQQDYIRDIGLSRITGYKRGGDKDEDIFHKLYIPPGANQFFWSDIDMVGIIPPAAVQGQIRNFEIVAADESGNESYLNGVLVAGGIGVPEPEFISYYRFGDTLEVDFLTLDSVTFSRVQYRKSVSWPFDTVDHSLRSQSWNSNGMVAYLSTIRLVSSNKEGNYRFSFSAENGEFCPWIYFDDGYSDKGLVLTGTPSRLLIEYYPDSVHSALSIEIADGRGKFGGNMYQGGIQKFYYEVQDSNLAGDTEIVIKDVDVVLIDTVVSFFPARPGNRITAYSPDSALSLSFDENSVYSPVYIFPSSGVRSKALGNDAIVYDIEPIDLQANDPIIFRFDLERLGLGGKSVGMYGYAPLYNKWGFIGANDGSTIMAEGAGLGKLALIEDNEPPTISLIRPKGKIKSLKPTLSCMITDHVSGVDLDATPRMWIDGYWVPAEYDIDTKKFTYQVRKSLKRTRHKLVIEATDNQGNKTTKTAYFTIIG